jgi:hypothetical protein
MGQDHGQDEKYETPGVSGSPAPGNDRRLVVGALLVSGGVVALVVLLVLGALTLLGGGGDDDGVLHLSGYDISETAVRTNIHQAIAGNDTKVQTALCLTLGEIPHLDELHSAAYGTPDPASIVVPSGGVPKPDQVANSDDSARYDQVFQQALKQECVDVPTVPPSPPPPSGAGDWPVAAQTAFSTSCNSGVGGSSVLCTCVLNYLRAAVPYRELNDPAYSDFRDSMVSAASAAVTASSRSAA